MKTGRNEPCPCGSGKKYKKCCLPRDEEASRQVAAQQTLWDDEPDESDLEGDDEWRYDVAEDPGPLDVSAITSVRYARGFVKRARDIYSEKGLAVTEWRAPIPSAILECIERERLDELDGEWGDPEAGRPFQVDSIDIETDSYLLNVHVVNRAILLFHSDNEELNRIHRACVVLGDAAAPESSADVRPADTVECDAVVALNGALARHRSQPGICQLCGEEITRRRAATHFASCAPAHDGDRGDGQTIVRLRVTAPGFPGYWLELEARSDARLSALDGELRHEWLECCGHLSKFDIGAVHYFSSGYDLREARRWPGLQSRRVERSMTARLADALPAVGERFAYEYDFGSTTRLDLKVLAVRTGRIGRPSVRLLARNTPVEWPCAVCGAAATMVCPYCLSAPGNPFACAAHAATHACGENESLMPVVNSPRVGVCGYTGEA